MLKERSDQNLKEILANFMLKKKKIDIKNDDDSIMSPNAKILKARHRFKELT